MNSIARENLSVLTSSDVQRMSMPRLYYEEDGTVILSFELGSVQSQMREDEPDHLVLSYTRTMTAFHLFKRSPQHIAMIGLGAGSMAKWCYRHMPEADITVIEINPHVIGLRERFRIPEDDHRFRVLCENGADYVARTSQHADVLLVDGFDIEGQPPELCSQKFYDDCYQALTASGLLVVNLCDENRMILARIRKSFRDQVLSVIPESDGNTIVFACKGEPLWPRDESGGSVLMKLRKPEHMYQIANAG
jgi:spermidine synthase